MKLTKELYKTKKEITKLKIVDTAVSAVLNSDTEKTGARVYDGESIGISAAIGAYDEGELFARAEKMLDYKIPYDCDPAGDVKRQEDHSGEMNVDSGELLRQSEAVLSRIKSDFPKFSASHIMSLEKNTTSLTNDRGADLRFTDSIATSILVLKYAGSANLMDVIVPYQARRFDADEVYRCVRFWCEAYEEKADIESEFRMPVVFLQEQEGGLVLGKFASDLEAEAMGKKTSLFSGKLGEKLFSEEFSLGIDRRKEGYQCFFDGEGTTLPGDRFTLVENGVLKAPFAGKKLAKQYGFTPTGSGVGPYDGVPHTRAEGMEAFAGGKSVKELLAGRKAIFVGVAAGGDFTQQGEFASPVQLAYYFDGEKLTARLPQLSISSNVFDMFGRDFIGVSRDGLLGGSAFHYLVTEMKVNKIGGFM